MSYELNGIYSYLTTPSIKQFRIGHNNFQIPLSLCFLIIPFPSLLPVLPQPTAINQGVNLKFNFLTKSFFKIPLHDIHFFRGFMRKRIKSKDLYYKTFYGCKLHLFKISQVGAYQIEAPGLTNKHQTRLKDLLGTKALAYLEKA